MRPRLMVWPRQSALGSHPCVALSSAAVSLTLLQTGNGTNHLLVNTTKCLHPRPLPGYKYSCSGSAPLAGFEASTYGRFSDVHRGLKQFQVPARIVQSHAGRPLHNTCCHALWVSPFSRTRSSASNCLSSSVQRTLFVLSGLSFLPSSTPVRTSLTSSKGSCNLFLISTNRNRDRSPVAGSVQFDRTPVGADSVCLSRGDVDGLAEGLYDRLQQTVGAPVM